MVSKNVIFDEKTCYYTSDKNTNLRDLPYLQLLDTSISGSSQSADDQKDPLHLPELSVSDEDSPSPDEYSAQARIDSKALEHLEIMILEPVAVEVVPREQDSAHLPNYPKFYER